MAKSKEETFAELTARLKKEKALSPKPVGKKRLRRYFLIVCEGERTEPLYFRYLKSLLPKHLLETVEISGEGDNTIRIVKKAIEKRDARLAAASLPKYEVWAVFDKDDFPPEHFNEAVALAKREKIQNGSTNQAFELWYVLHFQFLHTAIRREQYIEILSRALGFDYRKNDKRVPEILFKDGKSWTAIDHAVKLLAIHDGVTPSDAHPSTNVHVLVKQLLEYLDIKNQQ